MIADVHRRQSVGLSVTTIWRSFAPIAPSRPIDALWRSRVHVASATRYFSYYLIVSVIHPVKRMTNGP